MIAAHALAIGAVLVTNNTRHLRSYRGTAVVGELVRGSTISAPSSRSRPSGRVRKSVGSGDDTEAGFGPTGEASRELLHHPADFRLGDRADHHPGRRRLHVHAADRRSFRRSCRRRCRSPPNTSAPSAEVVEKSVTIPLEEQLNGAEGMIYMSSNSTNNGNSIITVTFDPGLRPEHRPDGAAEPGEPGAVGAAAGGPAGRRQRREELVGPSAGRQPDLAERHLRRPLSAELRRDPRRSTRSPAFRASPRS